jgi:hypothetical protein
VKQKINFGILPFILKQKLQNNLLWFLVLNVFACKQPGINFTPEKDPNYLELKKLADTSLTEIEFSVDTLFIASPNNDSLLQANFSIINIGNDTLKMRSHISSCECTKIRLDKFKAKSKDSIHVSVFIDKAKLSKGINHREVIFMGNFKGIYKHYPIDITLE